MTSLSKICLHWTGGNYTPCQTDINSYHYLFDDKGRIYLGKYKPEDNINCQDGIYARHCGGGNTGCIGLSLCGMKGFTESKKQSSCPITQPQVESMCCMAAYLSNQYGILINEKLVFTHYEFDQRKQKPEGKVDIVYISYLPNLQKERVGGYLRNKIEWYKQKLKQGKYKLQKKGNYYEFESVSRV